MSPYCIVLGNIIVNALHQIRIMALNIKEYCFFFFSIHNRETLTISTSTDKRTSMVIQTKQVFKYVLH